MRIRLFVGIALMVLAFIFLFGFIVFPVIPQLADAPVFDRFLGAILCPPDQTLVRDQYSQIFGSEQQFSMNVACQDSNEKLTDVTGKWEQIGLVGYVVPFLIGLLLTITSAGGLAKRKLMSIVTPYTGGDLSEIMSQVKASARSDDSVGVALNQLTSQLASELTPEKIAALQQRVRVIQNSKPDFTDKLKQIQEAHTSGLISDEEYERLRQKILDDLA